MANYINEEILCEAYTKLDLDIFHDKQKLAELEIYLKNFFGERAKFYLGKDVQIKIEFEEGSLITKLKVVGGAVTILAAAITSYGSFREGVARIAEDSTTLAQSANLEIIFKTKAAYCHRIDSERRKGIFGRVDELIRKLDNAHEKISQSKLPTNTNTVKAFNSTLDNLISWEQSSGKFFSKITDDATNACLSAGLLEELEKFPDETPWGHELEENSFKQVMLKSDPALISQIAAINTKYTFLIKSIKVNMRNRVNLYTPKEG